MALLEQEKEDRVDPAEHSAEEGHYRRRAPNQQLGDEGSHRRQYIESREAVGSARDPYCAPLPNTVTYISLDSPFDS